MLEENGPTLPRPYADILEDGIHELRIKLSGRQERILYFFVFHKCIILTHAFTKKPQRFREEKLKRLKNAGMILPEDLQRLTNSTDTWGIRGISCNHINDILGNN